MTQSVVLGSSIFSTWHGKVLLSR